jgi:hypothetical protein
LDRRDFIRNTALATGALIASQLPVMAGPFTRQDFAKLVPEDKKLDPSWIKSLFARGQPEVLRGANLRYVGMPIGGLCSGELYLGGDGRLWRWDIFNQARRTSEAHYAKPPSPDFPVEQGFALRLGGRTIPLDASGFRDVSFRGEYPVGWNTWTQMCRSR